MDSEPEKVEEQGISFYEGNLQDVFEKAKSENKLVFVDCYTTWCGPCKVSIPHLTDLAKKFKGKANFIGVSINEGTDDYQK